LATTGWVSLVRFLKPAGSGDGEARMLHKLAGIDMLDTGLVKDC